MKERVCPFLCRTNRPSTTEKEAGIYTKSFLALECDDFWASLIRLKSTQQGLIRLGQKIQSSFVFLPSNRGPPPNVSPNW